MEILGRSKRQVNNASTFKPIQPKPTAKLAIPAIKKIPATTKTTTTATTTTTTTTVEPIKGSQDNHKENNSDNSDHDDYDYEEEDYMEKTADSEQQYNEILKNQPLAETVIAVEFYFHREFLKGFIDSCR